MRRGSWSPLKNAGQRLREQEIVRPTWSLRLQRREYQCRCRGRQQQLRQSDSDAELMGRGSCRTRTVYEGWLERCAWLTAQLPLVSILDPKHRLAVDASVTQLLGDRRDLLPAALHRDPRLERTLGHEREE
jgi:hypothetical protein